MALPMLAGGADCGPSNALQNLTKRLDQDRGLQRDRLSASQASSSPESLRRSGYSRTRDQDVARFFGGASRSNPVPLQSSRAFDMSLVQANLPAPQQNIQRLQNVTPQSQPALAGWATDFMRQQPASAKADIFNPIEIQKHSQQQTQHQTQQAPGMSTVNQALTNWNQLPRSQNQAPIYSPSIHMQPPSITISKLDDRTWHQEFDRQKTPTPTPQHVEPQQSFLPRQSTQDSDDLAWTAGLLVESVSAESNPKFAKSQFMGLMRNLRDREIVVEGDKLVEGTAEQRAAANTIDLKGKGRLNHHQSTPVDLEHRRAHRSVERSFERRLARRDYDKDAMLVDQLPEEGPQVEEEDANEAYFKQENAEFKTYWDAHHAEPAPPMQMSAQQDEWTHLQESWDYFEATSSGVKEIDNYQFQENNPYLLGERSRTRHHMSHSTQPQSFYESVLELEAAVQRDPTDASAWYELGVKQQENEREQKAIKALRRAIELDPTHLPTYIALAVSYTNDNNRPGTYQVINEWVQRNELYSQAVKDYEAQFPELEGMGYTEKFNSLIQCLISMARSDTNCAVDADIQIAIAVLLNTNEDYTRAQDCFRAALSVRPDDWLLYNRVGATMANSGKPQEAIEYYYRALELNPAYIRARFNLGISCINLRRYEEAAQNILDALVLQDGDGIRDDSGMNDKRGVTSSALWDSLKTTAQHMRRPDLASLCDFYDLEGFRAAFP